mmetsp:Transcript_4931/g.13789  ORF Transcript_4931/g.13789 Transcript_4931/m.13789 type:complete len:265 (-) Transcript_4931:137-931(-)
MTPAVAQRVRFAIAPLRLPVVGGSRARLVAAMLKRNAASIARGAEVAAARTRHRWTLAAVAALRQLMFLSPRATPATFAPLALPKRPRWRRPQSPKKINCVLLAERASYHSRERLALSVCRRSAPFGSAGAMICFEAVPQNGLRKRPYARRLHTGLRQGRASANFRQGTMFMGHLVRDRLRKTSGLVATLRGGRGRYRLSASSEALEAAGLADQSGCKAMRNCIECCGRLRLDRASAHTAAVPGTVRDCGRSRTRCRTKTKFRN